MPNKKLTTEQKYVMFEHGTEKPFSSQLLKNKETGMYLCANCGKQLFSSEAKFDSGTGWPSFDAAIPGAIEWKEDNSNNMQRTEAICRKCKAHLGHIFDDGPTEKGRRFCINGCALDFKKS